MTDAATPSHLPTASALLTLAIEVCNPSADPPPHGKGTGVALGRVRRGHPEGTEILGVEWLRPTERNKDDLLPAIDRLCRGQGMTARQLQLVAVSVGPGGFTASRSACAAGKMIAEGVGCKAAGVPSALVAWMTGHGGHHPPNTAVALASKGETAWVAVFDTDDPAAAAAAGQVMDGTMLVHARPSRVLADGHLPAAMRAALTAAGILIEPLRFDPAACLKAAALVPAVDPAALVPIYPREPEAVTLWRQRHGAIS